MKSKFSRTRRTVIFSGWLPSSRKADVESRINEACSDRHYVEWRVPQSEERSQVPVQLQNPRILAPFELLVSNFATPEYGSIDPTPLVAVTYLAMFGLMFGDAGHGMVLIASGIIGSAFSKTGGNVQKLFKLLVWCGSAAVVAGILFGSYFGMQWMPPLWFDYHGIVSGHGGGEFVNTIYDVLAITVYFGVAVISLGLALNWINLVNQRKWFDLIFDKAGVVAGVIFGVGYVVAAAFVRSGYSSLPDGQILLVGLGIPVAALGAKAPLQYLRDRNHGNAKPFHPLMLADFAMEWIVELLEIFSGYLANTLSFMRVAGLGIAHEALMIAFFEIAYMAGGGSIRLPSILILVVGNVLVIVLEGLSAGIQSLRLNYYEFFSKYFTSAGRVFRPVSLQSLIQKE